MNKSNAKQNISANTEKNIAKKSTGNSANTERDEKQRKTLKTYKTVPVYIDKDDPIDAKVVYWQTSYELPFMMPRGKELSLKHNGNVYTYESVYCSFDIETTNVLQGDRHLGFMYHWQFIVCGEGSGYIILGRTWDQFDDFIRKFADRYELSENRRVIVWVANLGFEFQYIRKRFTWAEEDFFAREERHPLKCRTGGLEFHEALTISGGTLAQLAKDYTTTQKLVGDLDYDIQRCSTTLMKESEVDYCINDVVILAEWSKYIFEFYIKPDKRIPLTKTGILRSETRQAMQKQLGSGGAQTYRQLIYEAFPDPATYEKWFRYLFRGGYVHSNCLMTGFEIENVDGYDITSSYPKEMLFEKNYPLTPFKPEPFSIEALKEKCCIMTVRFKNIRRRFAHSIESKSKCITLEGSKEMPVVIDNGRVAQAAEMTVMITNLDYEMYDRFYKWSAAEILTFETSERGYLPLFIRKTLAKYYILKSLLKRSAKADTPEYVIAKQKVNSFFGMMVTRIELDKITYDNARDEWIVAEKALDFNEEIKSLFLLPQWGIFVTALARRSLLTVTADITEAIGDGRGENGGGVIYNDTDSIKVYDPDGYAKAVIARYNKNMEKKRQAARCVSEEFDGLGKFDFEDHYDRFKTLGAKRYLTQTGDKVKATIAGLPKQSILNCEGDPFDEFDLDGMTLDADVSLKKTISYNDEHTEAIVDGELMQEESSAGIYDISFTMNLDKAYYCIVTDGLTERIRKYGDA